LYGEAAEAFVKGYAEATKAKLETYIPLPSEVSVAAIVSVMNEEETLPGLLRQLDRLPLAEKIFVVNGSSDASFSILRSLSDGIVVHYAEALGHDVGRAIGAKLADSDILLFVDGDIVIPAERLVPFIQMVADGYAIALNDITPYLGSFERWDHVTVMKAMLNRLLARPDLKANSLTAVPHAISREAANRIGMRTLAVPPLAQFTAIQLGLKIGTAGSVDVITANKSRRDNTGERNAVGRLIIGDHLEALSAAIAQRGVRLGYADTIRRREWAGGVSA
jgi:glycosyltransferase involved in cell wall biosynthesis